MKKLMNMTFCKGCKNGTHLPSTSLLRIVVGVILFAHGTQKLFGWFGGFGLEGTAGFMEQVFGGAGMTLAVIVALIETVGGLAFVLGFMTSFAALLVAIEFIIIIIMVHLKNGFFAANNGFEFPLLILAAALTIMHMGAPYYSIDSKYGRKGGPVHKYSCLLGNCTCDGYGQDGKKGK